MTTRRNFRCTSKKCRIRFVRYTRKVAEDIKCPACGGKVSDRTEEVRKSRKRESICKCDGWWFPHRKGSKWCVFYTGEYTEEDYKERYREGV